jgi:hypothetical protein
MPTGRLMFLLFVLVLIGALVYLNVGRREQGTQTVTLSPKAYIERVEAGRQTSEDTVRESEGRQPGR